MVNILRCLPIKGVPLLRKRLVLCPKALSMYEVLAVQVNDFLVLRLSTHLRSNSLESRCFFCSHFSDVASCCSLLRSQCRMINLAWHCFTKLSHQRAIKIVFPLLISSRKECGWNTELYFSQSPPKQRMEVFHGGQGGLNKVTQPLQVQPFTAQNITFKTSIVNELRISGRCLKAA